MQISREMLSVRCGENFSTPKVAKSNNKSFCHYKSNKKPQNKENVGVLLNPDLVKMDADKPEINATFTSVFTDKISRAFEARDRIQGREDLPAVAEDQVRDLLRNFAP